MNDCYLVTPTLLHCPSKGPIRALEPVASSDEEVDPVIPSTPWRCTPPLAGQPVGPHISPEPADDILWLLANQDSDSEVSQHLEMDIDRAESEHADDSDLSDRNMDDVPVKGVRKSLRHRKLPTHLDPMAYDLD